MSAHIKVHRYSQVGIADAAGVSVHTVRQDVRKGLVRPADLASVSEYVAWRKAGQRLRPEATDPSRPVSLDGVFG